MSENFAGVDINSATASLEGVAPGAAPESSAPEGAPQPSDIMDLDSYQGKIKWQGREMAPSDLKRGYMLHSDYSKKTQAIAEERRTYQENKKYFDNLEADLDKIERDPSLVAQFKQIYPRQFHFYVDRLYRNNQQTQQGQQGQQGQMPPELLRRLERMESMEYERVQEAFEKDTQAELATIDAHMSQFSKKYSLADDDSVLAKAQMLVSQARNQGDLKYKLDGKTWEQLYKLDHNAKSKKFESIYKTQVNKQLEASRRARDTGGGGGIPGQAPKKMKLKDVQDSIIDHYANN